jgi:hypothetical protein
MRHPLTLKILAAFVFIILYPGLIVFVAHKYEDRARSHANAQFERERKHSDKVDCLSFNALAYNSNLFHVKVRRFMAVARDTRRKEIKALRVRPITPKVRKIISTDKEAVRVYDFILSGIRVTTYRPGCEIPKHTTKRVATPKK